MFRWSTRLVLLLVLLAGSVLGGSGAIPLSSAPHFRKVVLATNLLEPIQLSIARDGRVYLGERQGVVKVWNPVSEATVTVGQLDVSSGSEDGLLGLALDPDFLTNHWIYIFHSKPGVLENRVSRFTVENEALNLRSQKIMLRIPTLPKKPNHSGGGLAFDAAGNLYASTGDYTFIDASDGFSPLDDRPGRDVHDSQRTAANSNDLRGKILRIHPEPDGHYSIPKDNLFPPGMPKTLPEIYIMGCRNPFRFSIDEKTGWLFWGDIGPDAREASAQRGPAGFDEFNRAKVAGNFGWPYFAADNKPYRQYNFETKETGRAFDPALPVNDSRNNTGIRELPPAQPALIWYSPGPSTRFPEMGSGARSAMAGPVYHFNAQLKSSRKFPVEFDKALFLFEWERNWIRTARLDADGRLKAIQPFVPELPIRRPISMSFGPEGALYVIEWGTAWYNNKDSQVIRIEPIP
ncbi:MAG: glycosyl hydrolase [Pedosphaera sp.]|nr:glycosyl hydrolase [Pedosphaera sp.]